MTPRRTLPAGHQLVVAALVGSSIAARETAARLADAGQEIRLAWVDTMPEDRHGGGPRPGSLTTEVWWQERGTEPAVGSQAGTGYRTARTHRLVTDDGTILDLPVWRHGRRDVPHDPVCAETCDDCGTGDYWLLPQYIRPAWTPGLSDPADRARLRGDIKTLYALGGGPLQVRFTDHARYARGRTGHPEPDRVLRLMRWVAQDHADSLLVKHRQAGETVVRPDQVELLEEQDTPVQ